MPLNAAILLLLACLLAVPSAALAQIARVLDTKGANMVERAGKPPRILGQGEQLDEKDVISVARDSYAVLEFRDQTRITLRPNTVFRLDTYRDKESESMLFGLVKGGFRAVTGLVGKTNPGAVNFNTATATIGIRGTEFDARLCEDDCAAEERRSTRPALPVAARLVDLKGSVVAVNVEGISRKLVPGSYLRQFDEVRTAKASYAVLLLRDGGRLVVHPDTRIVFQRFKYEPARPADAEVDLMLLGGRIGTQTGAIGKARPVGYRISTRFGRLETRGTATDISCVRACAEPERRAGDRLQSDARGEVPARPAGLLLPVAAAKLATESSPGFPTPDWRAQAMTPQTKQAVVDYAQQAGLSAPVRIALQSALNASPSLSYQQLQQRLESADSATWGTLLSRMAAASGPEALTAALGEPLPVPDWHTQAVGAQVKQALVAYVQNQGGDVASFQQVLNQNPPITYAQLQQVLDQGASMPWVASLAQSFAAASSPVALLGALNTLDWRSQPVSEQTRQAITVYLQQMGMSAADAAGFSAQLSTAPLMTYGQLQQALQQVAYMLPMAGPLAAVIASASDLASLNNTLSTADWRMQAVSEQAKQAIIKYALDQGMPAAGTATLQALLTQTPPFTYEQLQQLMQQASEPWAVAVAAAFAGASSVDALVSTLDWRTQLMSAEAKQAFIALAQQLQLSGAEQLWNMSVTYEQLQQMLQSDPNWTYAASLLAGASSPQALVAALGAPPDWRLLAISEPVKQALLAYAQQHGGDVGAAGLQQAFDDYPTYGLLQQALEQAAGYAPWVGELATMLAGANGVDALAGALNAADWRNQVISGEVLQAMMAYALQEGVATPAELGYLQQALNDISSMTYAQVQQALMYASSSLPWMGSLPAVLTGASSFDSLMSALNSPPDWRTQPMSAAAQQALIAYAQQLGLPGADMVGGMISSLTYAQLQQLLQSEPSWGPVAAMIAGASNAYALIDAFGAPPDWRLLAISEPVKQALLAYAQQHGGDVGGLQRAFDDYPTYGLLQQALEGASAYLTWVGPLATMFGDAGSADALLSALSPTVAETADAWGMEVSVSEGAVEVTTSAGTQTVMQGQSASLNRPGGPLQLVAFRPAPVGSTTPDIQLLRIDSGRTFGDEAPMTPERGLYVWVRDGAVQLAKGGDAVDVSAGGAAVATADRVVLLDVVPNFMRFDSTPRPLPAGGTRVADAFVAADGSQSSMCIVR